VTAKKSIVLAPSFQNPFPPKALMRVFDTTLSSAQSDKIPKRKPSEAGIKESDPILLDNSIDGIKRLHTEQAIITPEAKPFNDRASESELPFLRKKTAKAPSDVPIKGISEPKTILKNINTSQKRGVFSEIVLNLA
jgi:hypothetical protein